MVLLIVPLGIRYTHKADRYKHHREIVDAVFSGKVVPRFKPSKHKHWSITLPENWLEIRQEVIKRDKTCQMCGKSGHGIHHKNRNRMDNNLDNLVYLCWPCHRSIHNFTNNGLH